MDSWQTSSQDGFLATDNFFSLSTLSVGTHTITVTATDSGGLSDSATVQITINESTQNQSPSLTLNRPIDGSQYDEGTRVIFWASATDNEDGSLSSSIQWTSTSSQDGFLATDNFFSLSTLSVGTHTITVTATDSGGLSDTGSIIITIVGSTTNTAPTVSVSSP
jgi:hypothetical protein